MKFTIRTTALLFVLVFIILGFKNLDTRNFVFALVQDTPTLPDIPFDYSADFPAHLLAEEDSPDTGYEAGEIDSTAFHDIDDDISTLGRVLFYDKKLSAMENISCGSCHIQENSFAEEKQFSEGISALTKRNSMTLNDLAWTSQETFFWDMSQTDLHTMIQLPLKDENEIGAVMEDVVFKLNDTDYYPQLFQKAFGTRQITEERIVDALVNFIKSMHTFNSRFDQQADINFKDFTEKERHGKNLFASNCTSCHSEGAGFGTFGEILIPTGGSTHPVDIFPFIFNNGLALGEDLGVGEWHESPFNNHLFKIPTLRNIAVTGPYMHDGQFETLEQVIDHYSEGVVQNEWTNFFIPGTGFGFDDEEKEALIAFLHTLTDETFFTNPKWSDPFEFSLVEDPIPAAPLYFDVTIAPNPMMEQALITFRNPLRSEVSLNVFDVHGRLIHQTTSTLESISLDKSLFTTGTYFLELQMDNKMNKQKLVVQ